jgi:hypothetical protein
MPAQKTLSSIDDGIDESGEIAIAPPCNETFVIQAFVVGPCLASTQAGCRNERDKHETTKSHPDSRRDHASRFGWTFAQSASVVRSHSARARASEDEAIRRFRIYVVDKEQPLLTLVK